MTKFARLTRVFLCTAALTCFAGGIALASCAYKGPCVAAHETDSHTCSPDNCLEADYWTTAVPGDCYDQSGSSNCHEDGVTNVTIHKRNCSEEIIGTDCDHTYCFKTDDKEVANCYTL